MSDTIPNRLVLNPKFRIGQWVRAVHPPVPEGVVVEDSDKPRVGMVTAHEVYTDHEGTRTIFEVRFRQGGFVDKEPYRFRAEELEAID